MKKLKYRYPQSWDTLLLDVRRRFGCDRHSIPSCFRVEKRWLTYSLRMIVYCDFEPPMVGEFCLGYVEVHEDGLISWEYDDWLKENGKPRDEIFVVSTDLVAMTQVEAFLDDLKAAAAAAIGQRREQARQKQEQTKAEKVEKDRLTAEATERGRVERERLKGKREEEDRERLRVRRMKAAQRRERKRLEVELQRLEKLRRAEVEAWERKITSERLREMREDRRVEWVPSPHPEARWVAWVASLVICLLVGLYILIFR